MNLEQLEAAAREDLDDKAEPFLWSRSFLWNAANEAESEACRRARLIVQSSEGPATRIDLVVGEPTYKLHPSVIFVRRVKSPLRTQPLCKIRTRDLDTQNPGWEDALGDVTHFVLDSETGIFRPYRIPTSDTVTRLALTVVRTPLKPMSDKGHSPEILPRYHYALRHYMTFLAYMKPDEDTYRPDKAKIAMQLFEREFGPPSTAVDEKWIADNHGYDQDEGLY